MARAARTAAAPPSTPCPRSSKPCAAASRCWSTAGSGAAPTSSRAWPSAQPRCASAGLTSGAWAPSASPASSACSNSCASSCRRRCSNAACARSGSSRRRSCAGRPERAAASLRGRSDRLAFLDDVGDEHLRRAAADVFPVVHLAGFDEEHVARLQRPGWLAVDFEHQRALEEVADLLARMRMLARGSAGTEFRQHLHRMAVLHAHVLILQHFARKPRLLRIPQHGDTANDYGACDGDFLQLHGPSPLNERRVYAARLKALLRRSQCALPSPYRASGSGRSGSLQTLGRLSVQPPVGQL